MLVRRFVCAAALTVAMLVPHSARAAAVTGPQVGSPAPAFTLKTIDGRTVTLDSFRGKTLVINMWATWCPPCREETPDLLKSYTSLHSSDVVFLGVDSTEEAPIVRAFVAAKGVPYAQAIDRDRRFATAYDIRYFPTTVVIDPAGILRARFIDVIAPDQLRAFVVAAKSGHDGVITSALQSRIDALLLPERYDFSGDATAVHVAVKAASDAIDRAEALVSASDAKQGRAVDFLHVRSEELVLRDRIVAALEPVATTPADRGLLARLKGDASVEREQWKDAVAHYDEALAIDPADQDALGGVADAAGSAQQYDRSVDAYRRLAELAPSPDAFIELGNAYKKTGDYVKGADAFEHGVALAKAAVDAKPEARAIRKLGSVYLYQGRLYAAAGEKEQARLAFANLTAWTLKLPKNDSRYEMYLEESQEATVALDTDAAAGGKTAVSLAPWTGPDLPGSVSSTFKYRLVVSGTPGRAVTLSASGLPKSWIASFCTDRVCAPFKVVTSVGPSGVKVIEFQVIPDGPNLKATPNVRVDALSAGSRSSASVVAKAP
jgi:peroxiredoxin/tetratricopeptide (TPR) repeat protein